MNSQCQTLMMPEIPTLIDQGEIVKSTEMVSSAEDCSNELLMSDSHDASDSYSN